MIRREIGRISAGKPLYKRSDVDVLYASSVLGGYGNGAAVGYAELAPVSDGMIVNPGRDRIKHG